MTIADAIEYARLEEEGIEAVKLFYKQIYSSLSQPKTFQKSTLPPFLSTPNSSCKPSSSTIPSLKPNSRPQITLSPAEKKKKNC